MKFPTRIFEAKFIKRYKRFFADAELNGQIVVAHVANTGSLKSALIPGASCLISEAANPERKLRFSLEAIQASSKTWVGVNTSWPNLLVGEAFEKKLFPHWKDFDYSQNEVKISKESRIDWVFSSQGGKTHYLEVKNVTMASGDVENKKGIAHFPDAVTERGQKHLKELMRLIEKDSTKKVGAEIFFAVQRQDCKSFSPADDIDPEYGKLLRLAHKKGVLVTAAVVDIDKLGLSFTGKTLPVKL